MSEDDPKLRRPSQAMGNPRDFDDDPERFREGQHDERFEGSSGVLFEQAMAQTRMAICLCDPHKPEFPIVFANRAFCNLSGYPEE